MYKVEALLVIGLILCWTGQVLFVDGNGGQCACMNGDTGTNGSIGEKGERGLTGVPGIRGPEGFPGNRGEPGPKGHKGEKGQRGRQGSLGQTGRNGFPGPSGPPLRQDDVIKVAQELEHLTKFSSKLSKIEAALMAIQECGTHNSSWRQIAHIDVTDYDPKAGCPYNLFPVFNTKAKQMACVTHNNCSILSFNTNGSYSHVCGRVRGYKLGRISAHGFNSTQDINLSTPYADGVLITSAKDIFAEKRHLWTYTVSKDASADACPCTDDVLSDPKDIMRDYHCEIESTKTSWENPLWDGADCVHECCDRKLHGWFHTDVELTDDSIQVRWCGREKNDIVTDILQIWVQ